MNSQELKADSNEQQDAASALNSAKLGARRERWAIVLATLLIILASIEGFSLWQIHKLRNEVSGLEWSDALHERDDDSVITTDVGVIQFMKKGGYSVTVNSAKYTADGLYLQGTVGNPTHLTITNLILKFSVTKPLYQYEDEFEKNPYVLIFGPQAIGEAQASPIAYLGSGSTSPFEVTIPNVKQTKDGMRLVVEFSGERYTY